MSKGQDKLGNTSWIIKCPGCGCKTRYDQHNEFRPFCSHRCQIQDTAAWAEESYRVPGQPVNEWELESLSEGGADNDDDR